MKNITKVAAVHDISGFGRASLTTIIPVLATMEIQTCPVPTAMLSTHSSGFGEYTFKDLTDELPAYINHWKEINLDLDCIYSGFLGSAKQIDIVIGMIKSFEKENPLIVVDPVLGDDGKLYSSICSDMVPEMKRLIAYADIITPNYTEANLLLNREKKPLTLAESKDMLRELSSMGPKIVVITSFMSANKKKQMDTIMYDKEQDAFWCIPSSKLPVSYPGTGDLFTSVLVGNILHGESLPVSAVKASQFVYQCIQVSRGYDYPVREGVLLERQLPLLRKFTEIGEYFSY